MVDANTLTVKIFADGADLATITKLYENPVIKGFTTNPTLMRIAGVANYAEFAQTVLRRIPDRPISFEVFADNLAEMEWQAMEIASWGGMVNVKIPVTNTQGVSTSLLVKKLARAGVRLNVTALMTLDQVRGVADSLADGVSSYVSVFAGRIADTGRDPLPIMSEAVRILSAYPHLELIWASPRELLNVFQADSIGCQVITVTPDVLKKLKLVGKDLAEYSLETVRMFYDDASKSEFSLTRTVAPC